MNSKDVIRIVLTAIAYYMFSNEFFKFASEIKGKKVSYKSRLICFLFIYVWFIFASYLELPLVVNWFFFMIILGLELLVVFSFDFIVSYALSIFCVIMGLATNIFCRSLLSIIFDLPLNVFDNTLSTLKIYPVLLGFMVMVILLYVLRRVQFTSKLEQMLHYRKSLSFYTWTEIFIYLFLMFQIGRAHV